ncbi:MAG: PadR family transcriptional regulator [Candidatus Andeanibacterium colombiense]|uniref:PadR family transcriptional regulator n=1 Tax=Candidatus Andeanibacterium colombiense TaxID=3121345 RepID=A0AAJ6BP04_9SPHN|nr:MAG: PadR family transcriptional regulator [Sphingomonadaceae bacterium]
MHNHRHGGRGRRGKGFERGFGAGAPFFAAMENIGDEIGRKCGQRGFGGGFGRGGGWGDDFASGFGSGFGGFGGRGGGRRGRMFASGELRLVLLKLIADEPRHGYELIKALEELTGGTYVPSAGTIYPTLALLADEGAIEDTAGEGSRRAFAATDAGRKELEERGEEAEALLARLAELGKQDERHRSPEVLRALMNLGGVLKNSVFKSNPDAEKLQQIVDIIDETAKRIERL